jgi:hypothetical protein
MSQTMQGELATGAIPSAASQARILGHSRGFATLFMTEMCEQARYETHGCVK